MERDYFLLAIADYVLQLEVNGRKGFTYEEIVAYIVSNFMEPVPLERSKPYLDEALKIVVDTEIVSYFPDRFAGDFYARRDSAASFAGWLSENCQPYAAYEAVGNAGSGWLVRALRKIEELAPISGTATVQLDSDGDRWEPLPVEMQRPEVADLIDKAKGVVSEIRADNGFAAEYPTQRDSMIAHAEATVASAEAGLTTKKQIRENWVAAGRWLLEKFGGTSIGALGGELVKLGLRLLGLIS